MSDEGVIARLFLSLSVRTAVLIYCIFSVLKEDKYFFCIHTFVSSLFCAECAVILLQSKYVCIILLLDRNDIIL
jgi:hypothetical protein